MDASQNLSAVDWRNKRVGVLGFGIEGAALCAYLQKKGADVWILDKRQKDELDQQLLTHALNLGVTPVFGDAYLSDLTQFSYIFRSPGVQLRDAALQQAAQQGVIITSQTKLFFDLCPAPIIGVTGTKGKGTTATLIFEILKEAGKDVYLGGNIGVPPITFLENVTPDSWVVLELSSFQLHDLQKSPHIAVMLMVTSEHMDYHETLEEYVEAKRNLLRFQTTDDFAILNRDYPATNESDVYTEGTVYRVSRERETDNACFVSGGAVIVRKNGNDDRIINASDIRLPGKHNLENVCAAVMAAKVAGIADKYIVPVLKTFSGLEHRLQLVREVNGVAYYDDSFSTTPETAIAAIEAFSQPKILILGGSSKGSNFEELGKVIRGSDSIKAIIGIGDEWERIKDELGTQNKESSMLIIEGAENMQTIVTAAAKTARGGDVVLLSPACASFGMFRNYKDRGNQFQEEVNKLV